MIKLQKKCLPRIIDLIQQIKTRIDQLQTLGDTNAQLNPRATARGRQIEDLLTDQQALQAAVDEARTGAWDSVMPA